MTNEEVTKLFHEARIDSEIKLNMSKYDAVIQKHIRDTENINIAIENLKKEKKFNTIKIINEKKYNISRLQYNLVIVKRDMLELIDIMQKYKKAYEIVSDDKIYEAYEMISSIDKNEFRELKTRLENVRIIESEYK